MANESGILLEYPILIRGGDGTVLWQGCGFAGNVVRALNKEASAAISPGQACVYSNQAIGNPSAAATATRTAQVLGVKRANTTGSLDRGYAGVALTYAAAGDSVVLAGAGSVVPVISLTTGSITNNVAGAYLIGSSTAGSVNASNTLPTVPAGQLGKVVIGGISGTTGGTTDSGSATVLIGSISPS